MSDTKSVPAATLEGIGVLVEDMAGLNLSDLPPFTSLLVWTVNSLYRVVVARWPEVYVQGGAFFPDPKLASIEGASLGGTCLRVGWICLGLRMEIRSGRWRILTSPVLAITTQPTPSLEPRSEELEPPHVTTSGS